MVSRESLEDEVAARLSSHEVNWQYYQSQTEQGIEAEHTAYETLRRALRQVVLNEQGFAAGDPYKLLTSITARRDVHPAVRNLAVRELVWPANDKVPELILAQLAHLDGEASPPALRYYLMPSRLAESVVYMALRRHHLDPRELYRSLSTAETLHPVIQAGALAALPMEIAPIPILLAHLKSSAAFPVQAALKAGASGEDLVQAIVSDPFLRDREAWLLKLLVAIKDSDTLTVAQKRSAIATFPLAISPPEVTMARILLASSVDQARTVLQEGLRADAPVSVMRLLIAVDLELKGAVRAALRKELGETSPLY